MHNVVVFAENYLLPIGYAVGALGLWVFLGWVFGAHSTRMRNAVQQGCTATASALHSSGERCYTWARQCFTWIESIFNRIRGHMPKGEGLTGGTTPVSSAMTALDAKELNPTIVALAAIALAFFVAVNGYLLFEITPDLFSLSPNDLAAGSGKYIAWLVPIAILAGEVIGGMLVKHEHRRKAAGSTEASTKFAWAIFAFCYGVEGAAGLRRAATFLESASPFEDEVTRITFDSAATAGLWIVLAFGIPWAIFLISSYVEPVLSKSNALAGFFRSFGRTVGAGLVFLGLGLATVGIGLVLGLGGVIVGITGFLCQVLGGAVRYVIAAAAIVLIVVCIEASHLTVEKFRGLRAGSAGTARSVLVLLGVSALVGGAPGCTSGRSDDKHAPRKFATVHVGELQSMPPSSVFDEVATTDLPKYIGTHHKIVKVVEPALHICLADLTESVRSMDLRAVIVERCAAFTSAVTETQGPEITAGVIAVVDAGLSSTAEMELLPRANVPTKCVVNPPIPEFPPRSTVADQKVKEIRKAYARALRDCTEQIAQPYVVAKAARDDARTPYAKRVAARFARQSYIRTDLFGTFGFIEELVKRERASLGTDAIAVQISVISDLEDDANECVYRNGQVTCPETAVAAARALCGHEHVRCVFYQVLEATSASRRGRSYAHEKQVREQRQRAWKHFWASFSDDVEMLTFIAPQSSRASAAERSTRAAAGCSDAGDLKSWQPRMVRGQLGARDWVAYGKALAACGPGASPWARVGLANRQAFMDRFVIPFVNRDAGFSRSEPEAYAQIVRAWGIDG